MKFQDRTRKRLVNVLNSWGRGVGLPKSPSVSASILFLLHFDEIARLRFLYRLLYCWLLYLSLKMINYERNLNQARMYIHVTCTYHKRSSFHCLLPFVLFSSVMRLFRLIFGILFKNTEVSKKFKHWPPLSHNTHN